LTLIPKKKFESQTVLEKIADEAISALKCVTSVSTTNVELADSLDFNDSKVLGVAVTAGNIGEKIKIITFGEIKDASFIFTLNEPLYLGNNGLITQAPPAIGFVTTIGHGLGNGAIFININESIEL
tara:strand:+ start:21086 stop:21463 length:378 start_codon:yes stop_codon:yes gene_type:complete